MGKQRSIQSFFTTKPAASLPAGKRQHTDDVGRGREEHAFRRGGSEKDVKGSVSPSEIGIEEAPTAGPPFAGNSTGRRTGRRVSALRAAACIAEMDCEGALDCKPVGKVRRGGVGEEETGGGHAVMKAPKRQKVQPCTTEVAAIPEQSPGTQLNSFSEKIHHCELTASLHGDIADRFGGREAGKFEFLGKSRRDAAGRRPTHPDYDPRTLYLPPDFLKDLPAGQRQWWEVKGKHMDKVLLFKVGKFYEMFEVDAHIGAQDLDLQYMKGDQPHCGFPERNYSENLRKLAQKGYHIVVVEQTETPEQLEQRKKNTGIKDKVVRREICAIVTKGTLIDNTASEPSYLMSITEASDAESCCAIIGVCAVDTTTGRFLLGQFKDDETRAHLKLVFADLRPVELIKPHNVLKQSTDQVLRDNTRNPLVNILAPGVEFWDRKTCVQNLLSMYSSIWEERRAVGQTDLPSSGDSLESLPETLYRLVTARDAGEVALSAFGGCCFYLKQVLLDKYLLASGHFNLLPGSNTLDPASEPPLGVMALDSAALDSLEILENSMDHSTSGTMLSQLDHCVTSMGHRLLRQWLLRPLLSVETIKQRQIAIGDLKGVAAEGVLEFRALLRGIPDLERLLAKIYRSRSSHVVNAQNVVVYEDKSKKEVQLFIKALHSCQSVVEALACFQGSLDSLSSQRLLHLLTSGEGVPDMTAVIEQFRTAFDWDEAGKSGRVMPNPGVNEEFDRANMDIAEVEKKFEDYLQDVCKKLGTSSQISYTTVGKEDYQIEIPDHLHLKVPSNFEVKTSRKGFKRYWSPRIKELLVEFSSAKEAREAAMSGILGSLVCRFAECRERWDAVLQGVAELDALISLSVASDSMEKPTCTPNFVSASSGNNAPILKALALRHPTLGAGSGSFVPNDVILGGQTAPFMVLTGPNMGGKSTLLRQVCSAVIMAQVGADVPAKSFELSLVDQIFVRMGASDHIMAGQSTFLVELLETAAMLNCATSKSLVVLDEVGRGTSTADGQAIAHAVLQQLTQQTGCRGLFSTHYHRLAFDHANDPLVGLYHMACKVGTEVGGPDEVTFLYKLTKGACPKSYGVNVARLAGLPNSVLTRAGKCAVEAELESICPQEQGACLSPDRDGGSCVVEQNFGVLHRLSHGLHRYDLTLQCWEDVKQMERKV